NGKFAFSGSGQASFLGLSGLGLDDGGINPTTSTLGLKLNRSGAAVSHVMVPVRGHSDFDLDVADTTGEPSFSVTGRIGIPNVFDVSGTITFRSLPGGQ